jgi:beta-phosphoglucomutase family hydrolase
MWKNSHRVELDVPPRITACLFDLDGVLTRTARVHARAWKVTFDNFLREWSAHCHEQQAPFRLPDDYAQFIDGKLREDGVRAFLRSRAVSLAEGTSGDSSDMMTVHGLANRKNEAFLEFLHTGGVEVYQSSIDFARAAHSQGLQLGVVSSSKNCSAVLAGAGIEDLFEVRVDGVVAECRHLKGKPAPDMFLVAAELLAVMPARAAVFEDAIAGVEAARDGCFGWIVGVDRAGDGRALAASGAHQVVSDLGELLRAQ